MSWVTCGLGSALDEETSIRIAQVTGGVATLDLPPALAALVGSDLGDRLQWPPERDDDGPGIESAEAERLFASLADGGQVQMPLTQTFFSPRFGMVADRFGVSWMIMVAP